MHDDDLRSVAELTNQATHLRRAGRTAEAVAAYREALERADENGEPMLRAMVRVNAGTAFGDVGDRRAATRAYEEALEILGPGADPSPVLLLGTTNLGGARYAAGDLDGAYRYLTDAFELAGRLGERAQQGVAIGHLGLVALARGELATAIDDLATAIAVADEERDLWNLQEFQRDLALAYSWLGLHREALGAFAVARDISVAAGDPGSEAQCLQGLGLNELLAGDERAHATLGAALSAYLRIGDHLAGLDVALLLTRAWVAHAARLDQRGLTEPFLRDGVLPDDVDLPVDLPVDLSADLPVDLPVDTEALEAAREWLAAAEELAASAGAGPAALAVARHHLRRLEGDVEGAVRVLGEGLAALDVERNGARDDVTRATIEHALGAVLHGTVGRPQEALEHYDRALELRRAAPVAPGPEALRGGFRHDPSPLVMRAAAAAAAAGDLPDAFARTERAHGEAGPVAVADVVAELGRRPGTALVSLVTGATGTLVLAFVPGADEPRVLTLPIGAAAIARDCWEPLARARAAIIAGGDPADWEDAVAHVLDDVGDRLLAPVAGLLAEVADVAEADDTVRDEVREVVLVRHGLLRALPLHAAPLPDGRTWLDAYTVSYAPSASAAVRLRRSPAQPPAEVAAVGDPTGDLPLAAVEARLAVARAERAGPCLLGPETSAADASRILGRDRWVHWAGHARHVLDDPSSSGLLHGTPDGGEVRLLDLPPAGDRPLAGTTVVLSACETGVVSPWLADGAAGLTGVLLDAGAAAVVATSWEVGEACAALVMDLFQDALATGEASLAAALRRAQLTVRGLGEDAVHDRLAALLDAAGVGTDAATRWTVLEPFRLRRPDVAPFGHPEAWGTFHVTGHGTPPALRRR